MKKIILVMVLVMMAQVGIFAQGYPVIDITSIIASIENGYTMVQQLEAMYSNIKTSYDQLQQQIKSFESFDVRQLNMKDPVGSWNSLNTYANRMMVYEKNIESIINRKDIKIGKDSYSLHDIFTTPPQQTIYNMTEEAYNFIVDPLEKGLTPEEREAFYRKYGKKYGTLMRLDQIGNIMQEKSTQVLGYMTVFQENMAEDRARLDHILGGLFGSESIVQQQQINTAVLANMAQDIKNLADIVGDFSRQFAMVTAQALMEKKAMQEEINTNDMDLSGGFLKMLDDMPSVTSYR